MSVLPIAQTIHFEFDAGKLSDLLATVVDSLTVSNLFAAAVVSMAMIVVIAAIVRLYKEAEAEAIKTVILLAFSLVLLIISGCVSGAIREPGYKPAKVTIENKNSADKCP